MGLSKERQRKAAGEKAARVAQEEAKKRSDEARVEKDAQRRRMKAEKGRLKAMCEAGGRCAAGHGGQRLNPGRGQGWMQAAGDLHGQEAKMRKDS